MLKLKTVFFSSVSEIDASVNEALSGISKEDLHSIKVAVEEDSTARPARNSKM